MKTYFDALASAQPTPGGGSAAAVVGQCAAALCAMVARITAQSTRFVDRRDEALSFAEQADVLRLALEEARVADEAAYGNVREALSLARSTEEERSVRSAALQEALSVAAAAPLEIARLVADVAELAVAVGGLGNAQLQSDVVCAAEFLRAALRAAHVNMQVNHALMRSEQVVGTQVVVFADYDRRVNEAYASICGL